MPLVGKRISTVPWEAEEFLRVPFADLYIFRFPCDDGHVPTIVSSEQEDGKVVYLDDKTPRCPGTDGMFP